LEVAGGQDINWQLIGESSVAHPSRREAWGTLPTNTGEWAPVEDSGGITIKAEQIAAVEFRKHLEVPYDT